MFAMDPNGAPRPRLLIVTRDRFPLYRVDLTELFSRWLTRRFDLDWVMAGDEVRAQTVPGDRQGEQFFVSRRGWLSWLGLQVRHGARVARGRIDLVQVRDAALSAVFFLFMAKIAGRPFVYWMSYPIAEDYLYRAQRQTPPHAIFLRLGRFAYGALATILLRRLVLPEAHHVFVQSERMKADLSARGVLPDRITAVPMGVSVAAYVPRTITPSDDPRLLGRRVLVYVGALDEARRIEMLAFALAQVIRDGFDAVLVIVGATTQSDLRRLEKAAAKAGVLDRWFFTGHLPLIEALRYVRRADVCLSPFPVWPSSYLSATPTKLVEYLAMGRPVVASDHPDQRQVIEESGAGVLADATAGGFSAAVIALLVDSVRAEAMGARGPAWVAAHRDYAVISRAVARVYDSVLERRQS